MRALSLWQPWATAVALGFKRIETRGRPFSYRGPLAIHAALRLPRWELKRLAESPVWCALFDLPVSAELSARVGSLRRQLPLGSIVAVVEVVDCQRVETLDADELDQWRPAQPDGIGANLAARKYNERALGDYSPGRYGIRLEHVRRLPRPLQVRGRQGLFNLAPELISIIYGQLREAK